MKRLVVAGVFALAACGWAAPALSGENRAYVFYPASAQVTGFAGVRQVFNRQTAPHGPAPVVRVRCDDGRLTQAGLEIPELQGDPRALDPRDMTLAQLVAVLAGPQYWFRGVADIELRALPSGRNWRWRHLVSRGRVGYSGISKYRVGLDAGEVRQALATGGPLELYLHALSGNGRSLRVGAVYSAREMERFEGCLPGAADS